MRPADAIGGGHRPLARAPCLVVALLVASGACAGDSASPELHLRLELTPETVALGAGDIVGVAAAVVDEDGTPVVFYRRRVSPQRC